MPSESNARPDVQRQPPQRRVGAQARGGAPCQRLPKASARWPSTTIRRGARLQRLQQGRRAVERPAARRPAGSTAPRLPLSSSSREATASRSAASALRQAAHRQPRHGGRARAWPSPAARRRPARPRARAAARLDSGVAHARDGAVAAQAHAHAGGAQRGQRRPWPRRAAGSIPGTRPRRRPAGQRCAASASVERDAVHEHRVLADEVLLRQRPPAPPGSARRSPRPAWTIQGMRRSVRAVGARAARASAPASARTGSAPAPCTGKPVRASERC